MEMTDFRDGLSEHDAKRAAGRYLTQGDPFGYDAVSEWVDGVVKATSGREASACEPYAGTNSLPSSFMARFKSRFADGLTWACYDISPCDDGDNLLPGCPILQADTLTSIPTSHDLIVTNPPYLARNSARRRHLPFPFDHAGVGIASPADLYQIALDTCLATAGWCAMLIPESFVTSRYDKSRLMSVISLPGGLFGDTECPVCLALFGPDATDDYAIYASDGRPIGSASAIRKACDDLLGKEVPPRGHRHNLSFNVPDGPLGLRCVDSSLGDTARFVDGSEIDPAAIRHTSRSITRIAIADTNGKPIDEIVSESNRLLTEWRNVTGDVLMTAFKGINVNTHGYRRRLSFGMAETIVNTAIYG